jgi:hypothetical protein
MLTAEERLTAAQAVRFLSDVLQPVRERGIELEQAITSMFAVMNVYTGDQAKTRPRRMGNHAGIYYAGIYYKVREPSAS